MKVKKKKIILISFTEDSVTECRNKAIHASLDGHDNVYGYSL